MSLSKHTLDMIADEVYDTLEAPREVVPFSERFPTFDLSDSYKIVEEIRQRKEARGERVVGRKIGFTNAAAWAGYGISAPIWNYLYDTTTRYLTPGMTYPLGSWPNARMETEVAFGLQRAPHATMDELELLECIEWAALDFEICTSIFPNWAFKVADAASTGVHVALLIGKRHAIDGSRTDWMQALQSFSVNLSEALGQNASGGGQQVLGSPLNALRLLLQELRRYEGSQLKAGDIVTTGTLTAALPAKPGEYWRADVDGIGFEDIEIRLA